MKDKSILPASWQVPSVFRERLGARVGRQRPMFADGHLLLVLHAPPIADQKERRARFFWRSPDGNWVSNEFGTGLRALHAHLDQYEEALALLDRREEEATAAREYFEILEHLAPLNRAANNLHRVLQEARSQFPHYRELIDARDRAYEIERTADLLFSETKNALDVLVARRAEEQSVSSEQMAVAAHRLNILAAFFFPIVTLMAIFGANLRHGLENQTPTVFLTVLAVGFALGTALTAFITRRSGRRSKDG
jgi:Mg2+ and Co2+ transporter CorA